VHHLRGEPIVPFAEHSSLGCAICDPVIAVWAFLGGPSVIAPVVDAVRGRLPRRSRA
jgi:hypothetical protein